MRVPPEETETELLLNAYVDGELDAASTLAFERRLSEDAALAAGRDAILALRNRLRAAVPRDRAPDGLRRAMAVLANLADATEGRPAIPRAGVRARPLGMAWWTALAACLVGAILGAGVTAAVLRGGRPEPAMADVVIDHLRAVMAPQPFDVASSDRHTVKPWFTGRLPFAPEVFDLAADGFPLAGGRVDVVGGQPAATLVYRHDKHVISLLSQPAGPGAVAAAPRSDQGFAVREWLAGGMRHWAVSDVAPAELEALERAFRARAEAKG